jgi:hypothetical protein
MLYDSKRVLDGEVPYRDFFNFPTPGTFWLQAIVFAVFGTTALNATYLLIVMLAALGAGLYLLSLSLSGRPLISLFAPVFVLSALAPHFPFPYHHWYAITSSTWTLVLMSWWLQQPRTRILIAAGAGCALTLLFVQTQGLVLGLAIGFFLLLKSAGEAHGIRAGVAALRRDLMSFALGIVLIALPVIAYFFFAGGLGQFVYDTVIWPSRSYGANNQVPFSFDISNWIFWRFDLSQRQTFIPMTQFPVRFYGGLWITLGAVIVPITVGLFSVVLISEHILTIVRHWMKGEPSFPPTVSENSAGPILCLCSIFSGLLFVSMLTSPNKDMIHMTWSSIPAYPTLLGLVSTRRHAARGETEGSIIGVKGAYLLLGTLALAAGAWFWTISSTSSSASEDTLMRSEAIVTYVNRHTSGDDRIAAMAYGGGLCFYSRPDAIGYSVVLSPPYTTYTQLQEVAEQIRARRPKLVAFQPGYDWSSFFSFMPGMMDFVRVNYGHGKSAAPQHVSSLDGIYLVYFRR